MNIAARDLARQIESGSAPAILDVRSRDEFAAGHVPGAVHIPFWTLAVRLADVPVKASEPLVVYCGHGPRAVMAAAVLRAAGYQHLTMLGGHWSGWVGAGLPQESGNDRSGRSGARP